MTQRNASAKAPGPGEVGDRKPSVVVQAMGRFTAYHAARAAAHRGYLHALVTGRRREDEAGVPMTLRRHIRLPAYLIYAGWLPMIGNRQLASRWCDAAFDRLASRYAEPVSVFHGFVAYSYDSLGAYSRLGARTLADGGACHVEKERDLVMAQYERFGVTGQPSHPAWIARQVAEYHRADVVLAPSSFVEETLVERGVPRSKIRVVRYGVDIERFPFHDPRPQTGKLRLLFVGNASLEKGIPYLLEAVKRLREHVELTVVGRVAPDAREIVRHYREVFTHHPHVPNHALHELMKANDVLVLPSIQDGSGMVVTEAMASGRGVIVTEHVGAKDFLVDGGGLVVEPGSTDGLARAIETLLADRSRVEELGMAARPAVEPWTWQRYGQSLCEVYEELAA